MNLNMLLEKQKELDEYLLQFFKYWKDDIVIERQRAIEEYIDVIHFTILIANAVGVHEHKYIDKKPRDLNKLFLGIANLATVISVSKSKDHVKSLINNVIALGYQLQELEEENKRYREALEYIGNHVNDSEWMSNVVDTKLIKAIIREALEELK